MAAILNLCKLKNTPLQGFLSANQTKFALQINVTAKPPKNDTLLMTARHSIWQLD